MRRLIQTTLFALLLVAAQVAPASADFTLDGLDVSFLNADGSPATQAGSHPFAMTTTVGVGTEEIGDERLPGGELRNLTVGQIPGFIGNQTAMPTCPMGDFLITVEGRSQCPDSTAVGYSGTEVEFKAIKPEELGLLWHSTLYNLEPGPGDAARLGFVVLNVPITIDVTVSESAPYNLIVNVSNTPQALLLYRSKVTLWGNPASSAHDSLRGKCLGYVDKPTLGPVSLGDCPVSGNNVAFLTLPRSCEGPLATTFSALSWKGEVANGIATTHEGSLPPRPQGMTGCTGLNFSPTIDSQPTTKAAASPTGLDFSIDREDEGLENPDGRAEADIRKAVVTLPEGFTANPSLAEGLAVCTESDLDRETASSAPGAGCPDASKIGTLEVDSPLLDQPLIGSLFVAKPFDNPFDSLIALYMVIKNPKYGIAIKQPLKVEPDPRTGQLRTVADDLPQLPFSHFKLHFREGTRSPLVSPPGCGEYAATAELTPSSGGPPIVTSSAFSIISGPNSSACPSGGLPPFHPGLLAGTRNNAAGVYSPFDLRLTRNDGEQEFTRFSIKLPPGVIGKLAGIPFCSDAALEAAKSRSGTEEIAFPSCPTDSEVGHTLVGAGVGPALTYAPGKVYLAGPYHGSALSIAAITAVKVGPFDLGTVVVREALEVNPETAEVFVDATGSDPIPHIIDGIVTHARDIRVYVNRPDFVLNPTNCERTSTASTVLGSGLDTAAELDDEPVTVTSPFQAASCASLGFKPKLTLRLKGGTKRGAYPSLKAIVTPRRGDANIGAAQVTLPHSEFLEQAHIGTVCTRVQFKQGKVPGEKCPAASIYGRAKAWTPLLDEPIQGPVFLRSSNHPLPDLVAALHSGKININLAGRIDSVEGGRIRNTFEEVPDAPVTRFVLEMEGGKKGLLVNSVNLCNRPNRAISNLTGQNGKVYNTRPVLKAQCGKKHRKKNKRS
jgi:hypothetical protein